MQKLLKMTKVKSKGILNLNIKSIKSDTILIGETVLSGRIFLIVVLNNLKLQAPIKTASMMSIVETSKCFQ
jgi:hypothetical protein